MVVGSWAQSLQNGRIIWLAEGWDGKYRGKYVPAGVYFYVIKARGADGVEYERAGDINIIKYKQGSGSGTAPAE